MHPADGQMNGLYVSIAVCNKMVTDIVGPNGPFRRWVNGDEWSGLRLKIQKHLLRMQELVWQDVWEGWRSDRGYGAVSLSWGEGLGRFCWMVGSFIELAGHKIPTIWP